MERDNEKGGTVSEPPLRLIGGRKVRPLQGRNLILWASIL